MAMYGNYNGSENHARETCSRALKHNDDTHNLNYY